MVSARIARVSIEHHSQEPRPFRICARCGRPTPTNVPDCVNCGFRSVQAVVDNDHARSSQAFARAYLSRTNPLTYAILIFNAVVYILMSASAGSDFLSAFGRGVDPSTLIAFGAKTNDLVLNQGEWFRLLTPVFIHSGLIHIASNSYALWMVGPQVERLYGSARFLLIYLLCGVGGVVGSILSVLLLKRDPTIASVGASGAIFGLFGVLAVFGYKYRHELPAAFRRSFGSGIIPVIAINLFIGFSVPAIDNGAHIGGLVCGAVLAFVVPYIAPGKEKLSSSGLVTIGVCVAIVSFSFVRAWQASPPHLLRRSSNINEFLNGINTANRLMQRSVNAIDDPRSAEELAGKLEDGAKLLDRAKAPDADADALRTELAEVLRLQKAAILEKDPQLRGSSIRMNAQRFSKASSDLREWVNSSGPKYGITSSRPE